jgi:hypothetical protein
LDSCRAKDKLSAAVVFSKSRREQFLEWRTPAFPPVGPPRTRVFCFSRLFPMRVSFRLPTLRSLRRRDPWQWTSLGPSDILAAGLSCAIFTASCFSRLSNPCGMPRWLCLLAPIRASRSFRALLLRHGRRSEGHVGQRTPMGTFYPKTPSVRTMSCSAITLKVRRNIQKRSLSGVASIMRTATQ